MMGSVHDGIATTCSDYFQVNAATMAITVVIVVYSKGLNIIIKI